MPPRHTCHWPGCAREVPPKLWGCREHWYQLPKALRDAIWREYRPGQEITKTPSPRYIAVAVLVQGWIAGKVTVNADGSIVVHEDLSVLAEQMTRSVAAAAQAVSAQVEPTQTQAGFDF